MMKKIQWIVLAVILTAIPVEKATAAVYAFNNGDMLLGFTSSFGTGSGYDVIIDIGTPTSTALSSAGVSLNLGTNAAVSTILTSIYGNTWFTNGYVAAALMGYSTTGTPNRQMWANSTTNNLNTGVYPIRSCISSFGADVNGLYTLYNSGGSVTTTNFTSGADTYGAISYQSAALGGSGWSSYDTVTPIWGGGMKNSIGAAVVGNAVTSLNAYYIDTNTQTLVGNVNINTAGIVSVVAPVPEPSTFALMGLATLGVLIAVSRRNKMGDIRS